MPKINPYQAWLGIPLDQQPPNHYRLLGIELFEADAAVIERGADRQMTYIRSLKLGEHAAVAEKLLGQISNAKICLLDAQRKQQYDTLLRRKTSAANERPVRTGVALQPIPVAPPPAQPQLVASAIVSPAMIPTSRPSTIARRRKNSNLLPLVVGGGLALLLLVGAAIFASRSAFDESTAEVIPEPGDAQQSPPDSKVGGATATDNQPQTGLTKPETTEEKDEEVKAESTAEPSAKLASADVDLPFRPGTIGSGQQVLIDQKYAFGKVDPELAGLAFTKHSLGEIGTLKFQATAPGTLYLLLPPANYTKPVSTNMRVSGWTTTDLQCEIIVDGQPLPCVVLKMDAPNDYSGEVGASKSIWPILAGKDILPTRRAMAQLADKDPAGTTDDGSGTPKIGNHELPPVGSENTSAQTSQRKKPPAETARVATREQVAKKFDVEGLATVDDKLSASRALVSMAQDTKTSADERYVGFLIGAELAADAGDLTRALEIVQEVDNTFEGSTVDLQLAAVKRFTKASSPRAVKEQQLSAIVPVIERAISAEKYDEVDETVKDLVEEGLSSPALGEQRKRATKLREKYVRDVQPALKVLASKPDDAEANRIVGDYLAVGLQDWPKGLKLLAKGDDRLLARVAKSELADPQRGEDQLVVAQGWLSAVNERVGREERGPLMLHAEAWYNKAWPNLPERDRQRAREQLGKLQDDMDKMKWPAPTRKVTIYASCGEAFNLAINGKVVLSAIGPDVRSLQTEINAGDIILVQAQKSLPVRVGGVASAVGPVVGGGAPRRIIERYSEDPARRKGFACAIVYEGSTRHIATGAPISPWKSYATESAAAWEMPKFVLRFDKVLIGGTTGGQQDLIDQSQTNVASIWGGTSPFEAYLYCKVP